MTGWTASRMPISHPPVPGEALDSWLQSYATRLRTSSRELLNHLGLTSSTLAAMVNTLTETERGILAAATSLTPAALDAMTLRRFDGIAVTIDPQTRTLLHPPAWRRQTGSRFCPRCLADDSSRWQLRWRLPWTFACIRHACLLLDHCPACRRRPTPHRPRNHHQPLLPNQCPVLLGRQPGSDSRHSQPCAHRLTDAAGSPLDPSSRVLAAQCHVDQFIDAATTGQKEHTGRGGALTELHLLAFRTLHALHHNAGHAPAAARRVLAEARLTVTAPGPLDSYDAAAVATGTAIAVTARHHDCGGDRLLRWLVASTRTHLLHAEPNKIMQAWKNAGPDLTARVLTALDAHLRTPQRLTYRTASPRPRPPDATTTTIARRAASLPSLLWPTWALALIPSSRTGANLLTAARADLAAMVLLCGTQLAGAQAATLLDHPDHRPNLTSCLPAEPGQRRTVLAALIALAEHLDTNAAPINYTRRRALFSTASIDHSAYQRLARTYGWPPASPLQHRLLDDHLATLLTGGRHTGHRDRRGADPWNPLTVALPTAVRAFVHDQAHHHLRQRRIREPLTWHPPLPEQAWPGIVTDAIDTNQFAGAFTQHAAHRCGLRRISRATGMTSNQIRLCTRITELVMPDTQWATLAAWPDEPGDPAALTRLHHEDHLPMIDITRLSLATERTVRKTLTDAGTPTLTFHPSKKRLTAQWFADNFTGSHKTCTQAAAELGISRTTFTKYAQQHGIETRPHIRTADPFGTWPIRQKPSAAVVAACSAKHGIHHLRQVVTLLDHPSQRAAAAALRISERVMDTRRRYIENASGIALCQPRTKPCRPITLTDAGTSFLQQARTALRRLDTPRRS